MVLNGHYQNGYVTRDLDRAEALLSERFGLGGYMRFEMEVAAMTAAGSAKMTLRIASAWAGGVNIELIEPVAGAVEHYRSLLPPDPADSTPRLHHIALRRDDLGAMRAEIAELGLPLAFGGESEAMVFAYLDARESLGHYLEYVWKAPGGWEKIGWPKGRPVL
jgi:hypothetical protein